MTDDGRRWPGTQARRLWRLGGTCWRMTDDGRRWPGTQASRLWLLGGTCWGPGEGVGHHVVHTRDVDDVAGVLSNVAKLSLLPRCPGIREAAQGEGEWAVVRPELERAALNLKPEVPDGAEGGQKLPVEGAVVDLGAVQLPGEKSQRLPWAAWAALLMKGGPYVGGAGVGHQSQLGLWRWV